MKASVIDRYTNMALWLLRIPTAALKMDRLKNVKPSRIVKILLIYICMADMKGKTIMNISNTKRFAVGQTADVSVKTNKGVPQTRSKTAN